MGKKGRGKNHPELRQNLPQQFQSMAQAPQLGFSSWLPHQPPVPMAAFSFPTTPTVGWLMPNNGYVPGPSMPFFGNTFNPGMQVQPPFLHSPFSQPPPGFPMSLPSSVPYNANSTGFQEPSSQFPGPSSFDRQTPHQHHSEDHQPGFFTRHFSHDAGSQSHNGHATTSNSLPNQNLQHPDSPEKVPHYYTRRFVDHANDAHRYEHDAWNSDRHFPDEPPWPEPPWPERALSASPVKLEYPRPDSRFSENHSMASGQALSDGRHSSHGNDWNPPWTESFRPLNVNAQTPAFSDSWPSAVENKDFLSSQGSNPRLADSAPVTRVPESKHIPLDVLTKSNAKQQDDLPHSLGFIVAATKERETRSQRRRRIRETEREKAKRLTMHSVKDGGNLSSTDRKPAGPPVTAIICSALVPGSGSLPVTTKEHSLENQSTVTGKKATVCPGGPTKSKTSTVPGPEKSEARLGGVKTLPSRAANERTTSSRQGDDRRPVSDGDRVIQRDTKRASSERYEKKKSHPKIPLNDADRDKSKDTRSTANIRKVSDEKSRGSQSSKVSTTERPESRIRERRRSRTPERRRDRERSLPSRSEMSTNRKSDHSIRKSDEPVRKEKVTPLAKELSLEDLEEGEIVDEATLEVYFTNRQKENKRTDPAPRKEVHSPVKPNCSNSHLPVKTVERKVLPSSNQPVKNVESEVLPSPNQPVEHDVLPSSNQPLKTVECEVIPTVNGIQKIRKESECYLSDVEDAWDMLEAAGEASAPIEMDQPYSPSHPSVFTDAVINQEKLDSPLSPEPVDPPPVTPCLSAPASPDPDKREAKPASPRKPVNESEAIYLSSDEEEKEHYNSDGEDMDLDTLMYLEHEDSDEYHDPLLPFEITIRSNSGADRITLESEDVLRARAMAAFGSPTPASPSDSSRTTVRVSSPAIPKEILRVGQPDKDVALDRPTPGFSINFDSLLPPPGREASPLASPQKDASPRNPAAAITLPQVTVPWPTIGPPEPAPAIQSLLKSFRGFGALSTPAGDTVDAAAGPRKSPPKSDHPIAVSTPTELRPSEHSTKSVKYSNVDLKGATVISSDGSAPLPPSPSPSPVVAEKTDLVQAVVSSEAPAPTKKSASRSRIEPVAVPVKEKVRSFTPVASSSAVTDSTPNRSFFKRMLADRSPARVHVSIVVESSKEEQMKEHRKAKFEASGNRPLVPVDDTKRSVKTSAAANGISVDSASLAPPVLSTKFTTLPLKVSESGNSAPPPILSTKFTTLPELVKPAENEIFRPSTSKEHGKQRRDSHASSGGKKRKRERSKSNTATKFPVPQAIATIGDFTEKIERHSKRRKNIDAELETLELGLEDALWEDVELSERIHELEVALQAVHSKRKRVWVRLNGFRSKVEQVAHIVDPENAADHFHPSNFEDSDSSDVEAPVTETPTRELDCPNYIRLVENHDERTPNFAKDPLLRIVRCLKKVRSTAPSPARGSRERSIERPTSAAASSFSKENEMAPTAEDSAPGKGGQFYGELADLIDSLGLYQFRAGFANILQRNPFSETFINGINRQSAYCFCADSPGSCTRQHLPTVDPLARRKLIKAEIRKAKPGPVLLKDLECGKFRDDDQELLTFWKQVAAIITVGGSDCNKSPGPSPVGS